MSRRWAAVAATCALSALMGFAAWLVGVPVVVVASVSLVVCVGVSRRILRTSSTRSPTLDEAGSGVASHGKAGGSTPEGQESSTKPN